MTARRFPDATCFFEQNPGIALGRRATAEGAGTFFLVLIVTGAGLAAQRLSHGEALVGLFAGALATAGALTGLIVAFGSVSGGHFNPLITGLQWLTGERSPGCTAAYVAAQTSGAFAGAILATVAFGSGARAMSTPAVDATLVVSEALATAGLMVVVFACSRSARRDTGPFAVGAWLASAIIATPSTSYANSALTIGALFAAGPVALAPVTAGAYLASEIVGALAALAVVSLTHPAPRRERRTAATLTPSIEGAAP